jgi:putative ABC transport system permease protein
VTMRLILQMLREHRWSYIGLTVVLVLAAALVGVSLLISRAASSRSFATDGLTRNEVAIRVGHLESGSTVAGFMVLLSIFIVVVLVFQIVGFMVDGRTTELALLRLGGAARGQVVAMLLGEVAIVAIGSSLAGCLVAVGAVQGFAQLLTLSSNWPAGLPVDIHLDALLLLGLVLVPAAAVGGAILATVRVGRLSPVDALGVNEEPARRPPIPRLVVAGLALAGAVVLLFVPIGEGGLLALPSAVGACAIVAASALAPLLVPVVSQPLTLALAAIAPGAGLVARRRIRFDKRRTGALAAPIIILLGLGAVFGMFAMTGRAYNATAFETVENTRVVAEIPAAEISPASAQDLYALATTVPEVEEVTRLQSTREWSWADPRIPDDVSLSLEAIDPATFSDFVPANVLAGDLHLVDGTDVAVVAPTPFLLGDMVAVAAPGGADVEVHVVAIVESTTMINSSLLVDYRRFAFDESASTETWLVQAAGETSDARLTAALTALSPSIDVLSRDRWIQVQADRLVDTLRAAIFTVVGGAAAFAMVGLALTIIASARERSREFGVLRMVGARIRSVVATVVMEAATACATAIVLGSGIVLFVYVRMASALDAAGIAISPVFPTDVLLWIVGLSLAVGVSAAVIGVGLTLRRSR